MVQFHPASYNLFLLKKVILLQTDVCQLHQILYQTADQHYLVAVVIYFEDYWFQGLHNVCRCSQVYMCVLNIILLYNAMSFYCKLCLSLISTVIPYMIKYCRGKIWQIVVHLLQFYQNFTYVAIATYV